MQQIYRKHHLTMGPWQENDLWDNYRKDRIQRGPLDNFLYNYQKDLNGFVGYINYKVGWDDRNRIKEDWVLLEVDQEHQPE